MEMRRPYYMAYDIPEIWHEEYMSRRDLEYMKGIYPEIAKLLLPFIENECERLEYKGSVIYDEYPDKLLLRLMCGRIHDSAIRELEKEGLCFGSQENIWVREMVEILTYQELCRRREQYREKKRRWY